MRTALRATVMFATALAALGFSVSASAQSVADQLFVPDLVSAVQAEALTSLEASPTAMPVIAPFWTDMVNVENVVADGEGVYVAILDTGMLPQAAWFFREADIAWDLGRGFTHDITWDDSINDLRIGPLRDDRGFVTQHASGHGTHVASTVVGFNVNNQFWVDGVAPRATIIPVLVLDAWMVDSPYGTLGLSGGTDEMIAAGIYYIADLAPTLDRPVVINMSLGGPEPMPMIDDAIEYAIAQGVVIVVSAGNSGTEGMGYPGGNRSVISAGAGGWASMFQNGWTGNVPEKLNTADGIGNQRQLYLEDFSSRPNKDLDQKYQDLDVTAPGAWVVGPYKSDFANDLNYYYLSGTSMAAPHVSGIVALLLQQYPDLGQAEVEAILRNAAAGNPLPASDAIVAFPFGTPPYYTATWGGGDYGKGFLFADAVMKAAK